jgi:hypothetical protein
MSFFQRRSPRIQNPLAVPSPAGASASDLPFRSVAGAMALVLSVAYAAESDARLAKPNDQRVKIAPLTLTYGQAPPILGAELPSIYATIVGSWPVDLEPRLTRPNTQQQNVAPLTLATGDQPPRALFLTTPDLQTISATREDWLAQSSPRSTAWQATRVDTPFARFPHTQIVATWQPDDRLSAPNERQQKIAPLTLAYGAPPSPQGPLSPQEVQAIGSWPREDWSSQRALISTAWLTVPSWNPFVPPQYGTVLANWPSDLEPRPHAKNVSPARVVPLTLAYGDPPVPQSPISTTELQTIRSWPEEWTAQSAPKSLAWFTPPAWAPKVAFPYGLILATWPADLEPRVVRPNDAQQKIATLTLPTGQAPPPHAPISVPALTAITAPLPTWDVPSAPKGAAWNTAVLAQVPYARQPLSIRAAWDNAEAPLPFPKRSQTATLSLVSGTPPPNAGTSRATRYAILLGQWPADLEPRPPRSLEARPQTVALTLVYGAQPPRRAPLPSAQWSAILQWQPGPNDAQWRGPSAIIVLPRDKVLLQVLASYAPHVAVNGSYVPAVGDTANAFLSDWLQEDFVQRGWTQ